MVRRLGALVCLIACIAAEQADAQAASGEVAERVRQEGAARVVVVLRPTAMARSAAPQVRRAAVARQREAVLERTSGEDVQVTHAYSEVAGFAAMVTARGLDSLAENPDVLEVGLDAEGGGELAVSVPQIHADRVRERGVTGGGATIAILDTGVQTDHPDLEGAVVHEECFCSGATPSQACCPGRTARASGPGSARSLHVHGIHVAGIALSRGKVSSFGVAPSARLVSVRVLNDQNRGQLSDWVAGLDWVLAERPDVRAVNMSLASDVLSADGCEIECRGQPLCALNLLFASAIDALRARGTLVFVASGNSGATATLASPACVSNAISVGAVDAQDRVARFSNGVFSNSAPGLDLLAPGVNIVSDGPDGGLATLEGTSMATPHATGTAALLLSAKPGASYDEILDGMRSTGLPVTDARNGVTVPRVDAVAAFRQIVRVPELVRGGGARRNDCLLEWSFVPNDVVAGDTRPLASCRDGDLLCDADGTEGQCTFLVSLCFNVPDPLLPECDTGEIIGSLRVDMPSADAAAGTIEAVNREHLEHSLPLLPIEASSVCGVAFPFVVPRGPAYLSAVASTDTRHDYDRIRLLCQ
jgi:subtilisin family serine protease